MIKLLLTFSIALLGTYCLHAQNEIRIIYVDNSKLNDNDALNDNMISSIKQDCNGVKDKNKKFILYMSNGTDQVITERAERIDKTLLRLRGDNTLRPNQLYDAKEIRDLLYDKLAGFTGTVVFDYYISGNTCNGITEKPSLLFNLLPKEIASAGNTFTVAENIYYPASYKVVNLNRLKEALGFYNQGDFTSNVSLNIYPL